MRSEIERIVDEQIQRSRLMRDAAREKGKTAAEHGPLIVISRQLGSGGRIVANLLAEKLGWGLWDSKLVDAIASDAYVSRKVVESFDERTMSEIEVMVRSAAGETEIGGFLYRRHLARALFVIALHGNAIIVGRGANFLLPQALSVRIVASHDVRIRNLVQYEGLTEDEAERRIRQSDHERSAFIRKAYDRNVEDPAAYDVVLRSDCFGIQKTVELIINALHQRHPNCKA